MTAGVRAATPVSEVVFIVIASDSDAISKTLCEGRGWRHSEFFGIEPQNEECYSISLRLLLPASQDSQ